MELAIILMILLIVVAIAASRLNENNLNFPFKKKTNLFTPTERTFLQLIEAAVGNQYKVICRVKVADILSVRQGTDKKASRAAILKAAGKQLDFVLCSKDDMSPVIAIDLVHNNGKEGYKTQRDWFISGSLDAARIPHVRIKVKSGYKPQDIRDCINAKLAPVLYKEPQEPIVRGTQDKGEKPSLINPVAA